MGKVLKKYFFFELTGEIRYSCILYDDGNLSADFMTVSGRHGFDCRRPGVLARSLAIHKDGVAPTSEIVDDIIDTWTVWTFWRHVSIRLFIVTACR